MDFKQEEIKVNLKTEPVDYDENCLPVDKSTYQKFDQKHKSRQTFDIWEMSRPSGQGFLGVVDEAGDVKVEGVFKTYLHQGAYSNLMGVCKDIVKQHPQVVEFYIVYLNSPEKVAEADLQTKIVFREGDKAQ